MPPVSSNRDCVSEILGKQRVNKGKLLGLGSIVMCYDFRVIKNIKYYEK